MKYYMRYYEGNPTYIVQTDETPKFRTKAVVIKIINHNFVKVGEIQYLEPKEWIVYKELTEQEEMEFL